MTETLNVALALPLVVEEKVEVVSLLVEEFVGEDMQKINKTLLKLSRRAGTIEIGVLHPHMPDRKTLLPSVRIRTG